MSHKKEFTHKNLGYKRPEDHSAVSKKHILKLIQAEQSPPRRKLLKSPWVALSGVAASLLLLFFFTQTNAPQQIVQPVQPVQVEEDAFVTFLLMETLLLDETLLDQAIQEALLENFENDLALN